MSWTAEKLVGTAVLAVSSILFIPAFSDAVTGVSFDSGRFSAYIEPIITHFELLLAVFALVVLASFIIEETE